MSGINELDRNVRDTVDQSTNTRSSTTNTASSNHGTQLVVVVVVVVVVLLLVVQQLLRVKAFDCFSIVIGVWIVLNREAQPLLILHKVCSQLYWSIK